MNSMFYIYIVYSDKHDKYYIGYTSDYLRRLDEHNSQPHFNTFTAKYRSWHLAVVFECGNDEAIAISLERFIKKQKSRRLLEKLIDVSFSPEGEEC